MDDNFTKAKAEAVSITNRLGYISMFNYGTKVRRIQL